MIKSKFDPKVHGLPYRNGAFKFKVGPINCSVLCGGISYTAMDYFNAGIRPPESPKIPVEGNPMETYIYRRQETAHFYTWHRFTNAWSVSQLPIVSVFGEQDSIEDLAKYLVSRPVIVCLYGGPFHGHHVIATGCDVGKKEISLYDSNFPGETSWLTLGKGGWRHSKSGENWTGWFMDWGQYTDGDRVAPLAYRYCRRCHGLNTRSLGTYGTCDNGGGHDNHPDYEYFLPWSPGEGEGGWQICSKCQGLFKQGSDVPFCTAGGMHLPQSKSASRKEVWVTTKGPGETNWRRCNKCTSLFWMKGASDFGACGAGGKHDPAGSASYVLDFRTL